MSYKNPFSIRVSERIETDERFLDLFSVEPLSYLEENYKNTIFWTTTAIYTFECSKLFSSL